MLLCVWRERKWWSFEWIWILKQTCSVNHLWLYLQLCSKNRVSWRNVYIFMKYVRSSSSHVVSQIPNPKSRFQNILDQSEKSSFFYITCAISSIPKIRDLHLTIRKTMWRAGQSCVKEHYIIRCYHSTLIVYVKLPRINITCLAWPEWCNILN